MYKIHTIKEARRAAYQQKRALKQKYRSRYAPYATSKFDELWR